MEAWTKVVALGREASRILLCSAHILGFGYPGQSLLQYE